jgi:hypothetical protein
MSTSGDRTSRLKFKISEQSQPAPCCAPTHTYLLEDATPVEEAVDFIELFVGQSITPYISGQDIAYAASATLLYSGLTNTTVDLSIGYSINAIAQPPITTSITLISGTEGTITLIGVVSNVANVECIFDVTISSEDPITVSAGRLLLAVGTT